MAGVLKPTPGISSGNIKTIPDKWDPAWFRRFVANFMQNADARNAIGANGITISGNLTTPATIGLGNTITTPNNNVQLGPNGLYLYNAGSVEVLNYYCLSAAPANNTWFFIGTLPANSLGNASNLVVEGSMNTALDSNTTCDFEFQIGSRNQLQVRAFKKSGADFAQYSGLCTFALYQQVNGSYNLYFINAASQFSWTSFNIHGSAQFVPVQPNSVVPTTTPPAGTQVWDLTNTTAGGILLSAVSSNNTEWLAPSYVANVANFGSPFANGAYTKDPSGKVLLRGVLVGAGLTVGATMFTLPLGFRPAANEIFVVPGQSGAGLGVYRVDVQSGGAVAISQQLSGAAGNPTVFLGISGIQFAAGY